MSDKWVEVHQIAMKVTFLVRDDARSYSTHVADMAMFMDTDGEWEHARSEIGKAARKLEAEVNDGDSD